MANKITLILIMCFLFSCRSISEVKSSVTNSETISLITLSANPEKFHNKSVRVQGYFMFEHEGNAIYVSKSDYTNGLMKNGVYLHIDKSILDKMGIEMPYRGYVTIEGIYNKNLNGSYGFFSGTIENISNVQRMYKRDGINEEYNID
jgi:hypothetical protein